MQSKNLLALFLCFCLSLGLLPLEAQSQKVMVFAPHPDDELIGCGGSMAKHLKLGNSVTVVYMTSGEAGNIKYSKQELTSIREQEAKNGLKIIGKCQSFFLRNKDGYLEVSPENLIKLVELIRENKPNIIYLPHAEDAHQDHKATYELVNKAIAKARGNWFQEAKGKPWTVSTILAYEVYPPLNSVTYCEDITEFIDLKYTALKEHKSQVESVSYNDLAKSLSRYRGIINEGSQYAECFQVIKISNLFL